MQYDFNIRTKRVYIFGSKQKSTDAQHHSEVPGSSHWKQVWER